MAKKNTVSVRYQFDHATDTLKNLHSNSEKVTRYTVSDFKSRGAVWVGKAVGEKYNIKTARVKKDFKGAKGGAATEVELTFSGGLLTAGGFSMDPKKRASKNKPYRVSVRIVKGEKKNLPSTTFLASIGETPQAFKRKPGTVSKKLEAKRGPQKRKLDQKRKPLEQMEVIKTLSVAQMIAGERASARVQEIVEENVQSRKDHHEKRFFK